MKMLPLLLFVASAPFFGCMRSAPTRYYLLSAAKELQPLPATPGTPPSPVVLRQLRLPEYLDRSEIVRRRPVNELCITDNHLWGEKLSVATATALERNLARLLGDEVLLIDRQHRASGGCRSLIVVFHQFDADADGIFNADGYCYLETPNSPELSQLLRFAYSQPLADDSVGTLVGAYNAALVDIAGQIAVALMATP